MVSSRSGRAVDEAFGARGEDHVAAGLVDRRARGLHAREREVEVVERVGVVAGEVLDRQPGHAGLDAARHVLGHAGGIVREAVLEIAVERHVGRLRDLAEMGEHLVHGLVAVGVALRMGVAGTGGGQRLEAETLQIARAAHAPGIGDDEAAGLVQLAEGAAFFGNDGNGAGHGVNSSMEAIARACHDRIRHDNAIRWSMRSLVQMATRSRAG